MKNNQFENKLFLNFIMFLFSFLVFTSCGKEDVSSDVMDIDEYIKSLDYDQNSILNVNDIVGSNTNRELTSDNTVTNPAVNGKVLECRTQNFSLDRNLDKVSILRPTNGVVWPGALIYGDGDMLAGTPRAIPIGRAPVSLRLDLPGMGEEGNIIVENPKNTSVQTGINEALEWWNANEYQEGYVNPSLSEYQSTESYSSNQLSLDLGINAEWATSSIESQLNVTSDESREVATMIFKQVFYSVTMDTPDSPGAVFGSDVTLEDVQSEMDATTPPAYVKSVDYGRIILFRMETNRSQNDINLNAVLEYATGVNSATVNTEFDQILQNNSTSISVITIGGNAETTSEAVTAVGQGSLSHILTGKNAVYSRDNPGLPIAYTIQYLKDNRLAKMGFTTDYSLVECNTYDYNHTDIYIKNKFKVSNIRVKLFYTRKDGKTINTEWQTIKDETFEGERLDSQVPNGAYNVRLNAEVWVIFDGWTHLAEKNLHHVTTSEGCWEAYENSSGNRAFKKC